MNLLKTGSGTQIFSGNSTYTGSLQVNEGVFQIGNGGKSGAISTGSVSIASDATLAFNRTTATILQNNTTNNGTISVKTGALTLYSTALGGTLTASENGVFNVLNKTVLDNSTFNVQATGSLALRVDDSDTTAWSKADFLALRASATPFDGKSNITWDSNAIVGLFVDAGKSVESTGMFGVATPLYKTGQGELLINSDQTNATATPITVYDGSVRLTSVGAFSGTGLVKNGAQFVYDLGAGNSMVLSNLFTGDGELQVKSGTLQVTTATPQTDSAYISIDQVRILNGAVLSFADTTGPRPTGTTTFTVESGGTLQFVSSSYSGIGHDTNHSLGNLTGGSITYTGAGTIEFTGGGTTAILPGADAPRAVVSQNAGGWIDVIDKDASTGSNLVIGGYSSHIDWTNNKGSINVGKNSKVSLWDGNQITIDSLTGSGILEAGAVRLGIANNVDSAKYGVANHTAEFSGTLRDQTVNNLNRVTSVTKVGTGTQILSGDNTYTGATTVSGGTLQIGNGSTTGTVGTGAVSVAQGATLAYNRSGETTVTNAISGLGTIRNMAGTLNIGTASAAAAAPTQTSLAADKDAALNYYVADNSSFAFKGAISGEGTVRLAGNNVTIDASSASIGVGKLALDSGTISLSPHASIGTISAAGNVKIALDSPTETWDMNTYIGNDGKTKPWMAYTSTLNKGTSLNMDNVGNNSSNASVRANGLTNKTAFAYTTTVYIPKDVTLDLTGSYDDFAGVFAKQLSVADGSPIENGGWTTLLDFGGNCTRVSNTVTLKAGYYLIDARVADDGGDAFANNASILDPNNKQLGLGVRVNGGPLTGDKYYSWTIDPEQKTVALPGGEIQTYNPNLVFKTNYEIAKDGKITVENKFGKYDSIAMNTTVTGSADGTGTLELINSSGTDLPLTLTGSTAGSLILGDGWIVQLSKDKNFDVDGSFTQASGTQYDVDITGITDGFDWFANVDSVTGLDQTSKFVFSSSDSTISAQEFTFFEGADLSGLALNWSEMIQTDGTVQFGGVVAGTDGLHVTLGDSASVPEPSSWLLLVLGAFGLVWYRKKR